MFFHVFRRLSKKVTYNNTCEKIKNENSDIEDVIPYKPIINLDLSFFFDFDLLDFLPAKESSDDYVVHEEVLLSLAGVLDKKFPNIRGSSIYKKFQLIPPITGVIFEGFGFGGKFGNGYTVNLIANITKSSPKFVVSNGLFEGDFVWDNQVLTLTQDLNHLSIIDLLGIPNHWGIMEVGCSSVTSIYSATGSKKNRGYTKPNNSHGALEVYASLFNVEIQNLFVNSLGYRNQNFDFNFFFKPSGGLLYISVNRIPIVLWTSSWK